MSIFAEKLDDYFVRCLAYFNYRDYVNRMKLRGDEKVLEVGSGGGNLSRFLAKRLSKGKLICIDNSAYWINKTRNRLKGYKNIGFKIEDILNLNIVNYFDVVVFHYVLHDIVEKEKAINVVSKSLKNKGTIYVREPRRKGHRISFEKIRRLMIKRGFLEKASKEGYSFPIKGRVYEGIFKRGA